MTNIDISVVLVGNFKIKSDMRDRFLLNAKKVLDKTKDEPGNISYHIVEDCFTKNSFYYVEEWESKEALRDHLQKPYTKDLFIVFPTFIDGDPLIKVYDVNNTTYGLDEFLS